MRVIEEIVSRYDVDGVHLDYVRYAWDTTPDAANKYPRDARTLAIYKRETGKRPDDDAEAWKHWRANQLTRLVASIRQMLDRRRPGATLTAAVVRNPRTAYDSFFQNGVAWLRTGMVDALLPMAYSEQLGPFEADIAAYREAVGGRRIVPGVGIYKHTNGEATRRQLARCADWGGDFALFSYESLYPTHQDRQSSRGPSAPDASAAPSNAAPRSAPSSASNPRRCQEVPLLLEQWSVDAEKPLLKSSGTRLRAVAMRALAIAVGATGALAKAFCLAALAFGGQAAMA